jgi:hypothetical protein
MVDIQDAFFQLLAKDGDFDGLRESIANALREGLTPAGSMWLADLFDPQRESLFKATISRRQGHEDDEEKKRDANFDVFSDAYYSEGQDIDRAFKKVRRDIWEGGHGWGRTRAYKYRRIFLDYLESQMA